MNSYNWETTHWARLNDTAFSLNEILCAEQLEQGVQITFKNKEYLLVKNAKIDDFWKCVCNECEAR